MRYPVLVTAAMILVSGGGWVAPAAARKKPPACPGGRFPVSGAPLVPGGTTPDAILIADRQVSTESGCAAVTARRKRTRHGTRLTATWRSCTGLSGRARLTATLDATTCETLTARFKARRAKIDRRVATQVEVPPDAGGRVRDGLPAGAVQVTEAEWEQLKQRPDVHPVGPQQAAADAAAQAARQAADEQLVMAFLHDNPSFGGQYLGGVDPADPSVTPVLSVE